MKLTAINKKVQLTASISAFRGVIELPQTVLEHTAVCMVVSAGKNVHPSIKPNMVVICEPHGYDRRNLKVGNSFFVDEHHIIGLLKNGKLFPLGRRVLIRRDHKRTMEGIFEIPERYRTQSLYGWIEQFGLSREPSRIAGLTIGDKIRLTGWNESMKEVTLPDGNYGLIVDEADLLCKIE